MSELTTGAGANQHQGLCPVRLAYRTMDIRSDPRLEAVGDTTPRFRLLCSGEQLSDTLALARARYGAQFCRGDERGLLVTTMECSLERLQW